MWGPGRRRRSTCLSASVERAARGGEAGRGIRQPFLPRHRWSSSPRAAALPHREAAGATPCISELRPLLSSRNLPPFFSFRFPSLVAPLHLFSSLVGRWTSTRDASNPRPVPIDSEQALPPSIVASSATAHRRGQAQPSAGEEEFGNSSSLGRVGSHRARVPALPNATVALAPAPAPATLRTNGQLAGSDWVSLLPLLSHPIHLSVHPSIRRPCSDSDIPRKMDNHSARPQRRPWRWESRSPAPEQTLCAHAPVRAYARTATGASNGRGAGLGRAVCLGPSGAASGLEPRVSGSTVSGAAAYVTAAGRARRRRR